MPTPPQTTRAARGANPYFIGNIASQNTNVNDNAIWMLAGNNYIWSDGKYSHSFRDDLLATSGFVQANYPMARKYGWASPMFHDAAKEITATTETLQKKHATDGYNWLEHLRKKIFLL